MRYGYMPWGKHEGKRLGDVAHDRLRKLVGI
jgi:hypothetical protein